MHKSRSPSYRQTCRWWSGAGISLTSSPSEPQCVDKREASRAGAMRDRTRCSFKGRAACKAQLYLCRLAVFRVCDLITLCRYGSLCAHERDTVGCKAYVSCAMREAKMSGCNTAWPPLMLAYCMQIAALEFGRIPANGQQYLVDSGCHRHVMSALAALSCIRCRTSWRMLKKSLQMVEY